MRRLAREEAGMTLVELLVVCGLLVIVMGALSNVFVSGLRAGTNANSRLAAQEDVGRAFDRLEYDGRCASAAQLLSSGAGVALTLPSQCPNATGTVSWCVTGGSLERFASADCTGTGESFAGDVTSATPFSCLSSDGTYPRLQIALTVDPTPAVTGDAASATDTIMLHNAALTSGGVSACS